MKIIGKNSKEIGSLAHKPAITFSGYYIYLSKATKMEFDLAHNDKIKFIVDPGYCAFFKTTADDEEGFRLDAYQKKGLRFSNRGLVRLIRETFGRHNETKGFTFKLKRGQSEINGQPVIEVDNRMMVAFKTQSRGQLPAQRKKTA